MVFINIVGMACLCQIEICGACFWGHILETDWALGLMNSLLWNSMLVAGPLLVATLVTGVLISVLQVATQIQEMTLSYVPKLLVSATVLFLLGPWMIHRVTLFALQMITMIPDLN